MYNLIFTPKRTNVHFWKVYSLSIIVSKRKSIFFWRVYKFRSVKVIELIFTTASKFIVVFFRLNRKWLKWQNRAISWYEICLYRNLTGRTKRASLVLFSFFFSISALRHCEHFLELFLIVSADNFYFEDKTFDEYEISLAWPPSTLFQIILNLKLSL